jgi:glycine/D-amino acid oxidase-like deaminating enzyme
VKPSEAIVVGSGIGGLVTAAVLAKHFEEVLLIDRDDIPRNATVRNGVPQGSHFHGILPGGIEVLADFSQEGTTGDFPDDEQASIEVLTSLRQAADSGSVEAETIFALIAGMREPLRILHSDKVKAVLTSST